VLAVDLHTRQWVEAKLRGQDSLRVVDLHDGEPEVMVFAAHSTQEVVATLRPPSLSHLVLLDLGGLIGPRAAALHNFWAYLPLQLPDTVLVSCLWHVMRGAPVAPEPYAREFLNQWKRGALNEEQREILHLTSQGVKQKEMATQLSVSVPTLERHVGVLRRRLDLQRHQSLAVAAVELGFALVHSAAPPEP